MAENEQGAGRAALVLGAFLVPGIVIVALFWSATNDAIAGDVRRLAVALPMAVVFLAFLAVFGRRVLRLAERR